MSISYLSALCENPCQYKYDYSINQVTHPPKIFVSISQAFTSALQAYSVNHVTSFPYHPQSNGLVERCVQIVKCLFNKAREEGKDFYKCLMSYHNTPLTGSLQLPMKILQGRSARSDSQMSNAARNQPEARRNIDRHEKLPAHVLHVSQCIMYQDRVIKWWHPAIITSLCQEKCSYKIKTSNSVIYGKTQAHLKPYTPQFKTIQSKQSVIQLMAQPGHKQPIKQSIAQPDYKKPLPVNNQSQYQQADLKGTLKPLSSLTYEYVVLS